MRIQAIKAGSLAFRAGLRAGDQIVTIDGEVVRDTLDYLFLASDEALTLRIARDEEGEFDVDLQREPGEQWGIELPPDRVRRCGNDCVFCFVDQNPRHLRRTLYVKDEDYRLSILYGNYVTLTNLKEWEIERILTQHLSPLYVSVHATDPEVRHRLLRSRGRHDVIPLMKRLAEGGIRLHTQIVLVPGYNDGITLEQTLGDLEALYPAAETVAIVPIGLTGHRRNLPSLRTLQADEANVLVSGIHERQERCLEKHGSRIHFLADEIYLLAGRPLPSAEAYESFPQIENGVGMVRLFEADLAGRQRLLGRPGPAGPARAAVVTGELFAPLLAERLPEALERTGEAREWSIDIVAVPNRLFGGQVTVTGLLSGGDIIAEVLRKGRYDRVVLPPEIFNADRCTLDDRRVSEISGELRCPVQVGWTESPVGGTCEERNGIDP